ncbi:MAG: RES domain-containing protein [Maricaulaceae bacterium]|nr:RES domain-containing protein [Maricaulaceae bacterium]
MTPHRKLPRACKAFRIGDAHGAYPIYSGEGSRANPGRWNAAGQNMIYAAEHYSTAVLEKLVRLTVMPRDQHFIEIAIPAGTSYEKFNEALVPGWYEENCNNARAFGAKWFAEKRSCILFVPSVVARVDNNILINPHHADFSHLEESLEKPIWWDNRLFEASSY